MRFKYKDGHKTHYAFGRTFLRNTSWTTHYESWFVWTCLMPVFILETHNQDELQIVCPNSSGRIMCLSIKTVNQSIIYAYVFWLYHARKHNSLLYFFCSKFSLSFLTQLSSKLLYFFPSKQFSFSFLTQLSLNFEEVHSFFYSVLIRGQILSVTRRQAWWATQASEKKKYRARLNDFVKV